MNYYKIIWNNIIEAGLPAVSFRYLDDKGVAKLRKVGCTVQLVQSAQQKYNWS